MRIYQNFREAVGEVKRDLAEMGIRVHSNTYQNKRIKEDPNFSSLELQNYIYSVTAPQLSDLDPTQPWADKEFEERISGKVENPGEAWKYNWDLWEPFLNSKNKFDYTYAERMRGEISDLVKTLRLDPNTRQAYLSIWNPLDLMDTGGVVRIPCSLGYLFQIRRDKLNITYLQRSSDFATHFINDVYLACKLQQHIAGEIGVEPGMFTHWIGSLHVFQKDVKGVF